MKRTSVLWLFAAMTILPAAFAQAAIIFSVTYENNRINQLDSNTGALQNSYAPPVVAQTGGGVGLTHSGTALYYSSIDNVNIFALNPSTGGVLSSFARPAGAVGIDGLGFGGSSFGPTLFALDFTSNRIYLVNPANGAVFNSYLTPFDALGGIDYDSATGELYVSDAAGVIRATNPNTGAVLSSFTTGTLSFQTGLGFDGGRLFTADRTVATISERNPVTGAVINSFPSLGGLVGALAGPPIIPEPSAMLLGAAGALLLALRRQRSGSSDCICCENGTV